MSKAEAKEQPKEQPKKALRPKAYPSQGGSYTVDANGNLRQTRKASGDGTLVRKKEG